MIRSARAAGLALLLALPAAWAADEPTISVTQTEPGWIAHRLWIKQGSEFVYERELAVDGAQAGFLFVLTDAAGRAPRNELSILTPPAPVEYAFQSDLAPGVEARSPPPSGETSSWMRVRWTCDRCLDGSYVLTVVAAGDVGHARWRFTIPGAVPGGSTHGAGTFLLTERDFRGDFVLSAKAGSDLTVARANVDTAAAVRATEGLVGYFGPGALPAYGGYAPGEYAVEGPAGSWNVPPFFFGGWGPGDYAFRYSGAGQGDDTTILLVADARAPPESSGE